MLLVPLFGKKKPEDMKEGELFQKSREALSQQNWEETSTYARVLVNKNPTFIPGRELLTISLIQLQNADEALEHCRYLIEREPQNAMFHVHLGSIYQLQGNEDEAIRALGRSLEIQENPLIRGMMLYLRTPTIPLVNLDALDNSKASILARTLASSDLSHIPEMAELSEKMQKVGSDMQDKIIDAQDSEMFMKKIADTCIDRGIYAEVTDLLKKYKSMDEIKTQLQILESKSSIKGRFAKFQHLDFVHFEKIEQR